MEWFTELSWQIQAAMVAALLLIVLLFFKPALLRLIKHGVKLDKEDGLIIGGGYQETNRQWEELQNAVHQTSRDVKAMTERMETMDMTLLKVAICNEALPTAERCELYERYKKLGGNSWVEQYFIDKIKPR
ncbi:MAG: hypothetical protein LBK63_06800, partial [Treponema sp.]|nr:hypothetical protein [Treponema sp.]